MKLNKKEKLPEHDDIKWEEFYNDSRFVYIPDEITEEPEKFKYIGFEQEEPIITNDDWTLNLSLDEDKNESS